MFQNNECFIICDILFCKDNFYCLKNIIIFHYFHLPAFVLNSFDLSRKRSFLVLQKRKREIYAVKKSSPISSGPNNTYSSDQNHGDLSAFAQKSAVSEAAEVAIEPLAIKYRDNGVASGPEFNTNRLNGGCCMDIATHCYDIQSRSENCVL